MNFINKNKKISAFIISAFLVSLFLIPLSSHAQDAAGYGPPAPPDSLVTCDGVNVKCNIDTLIGMINNIIDWIISIAGVIFTISCIYGGFLYITSGENPGNKAKAKSIMYSTLIGFVIILVSWLIVYTILDTLAPDNTSILKFIKN
jgi:hypothetical protein